MIDPIAASAFAVAKRTATAPLLVLFTGVVSSFGPCVAPRFVALAACTAQARRPKLVLATFLAGLIAAYASFGIAASVFAAVQASASVIYLIVALVLLCGGLTAIVRADGDCCAAAPHRARAQSLGGVFLFGASFAFVISPCCTPLVLMILAYTTRVGDVLYGAALLGAFAIGHALPLMLYGVVSAHVAALVRRLVLSQAVSVTSGALMVGLAGYYALLV